MRKRFYALTALAVSFMPITVLAAAKCTQYTGGGLMNGVCQECYVSGKCQISDLFVVGNTVTQLILGLSGSVLLLMVIYGGFLWLTSSGNSTGIEKGKKVLVSSLIGLIIVFGAYTAVEFLMGALGVANTAEVFSRPFTQKK
jgi:hypothetical protein